MNMGREVEKRTLWALFLDFVIAPLSTWLYVLLWSIILIVGTLTGELQSLSRSMGISLWVIVAFVLLSWWIVILHGVSRWKQEQRNKIRDIDLND